MVTRDKNAKLGRDVGIPREEILKVHLKKRKVPLDKDVDHISIDGVNSTDASNYIVARTGEIIANIKQQIQYAGIKTVDLHNVVLIGGGAQLQGIAHRLEDEIKLRVRMGSYPHELNILDHNINRAEYIQIFSLLSKAANVTPFNQSCVRLNNFEPLDNGYNESDNYPDSGNNNDPYSYDNFTPEAPTTRAASTHNDENPDSRGKRNKNSWIERYIKKFNNLISEPEDDEQDF